ncbi:P4HA1-like protein [Mya arenaria]|uniref:P4HA1-like protein n=1 Tax=Mya arenaria TaxID=6604 RepID=A0ABY7DUB9_MYAAR|nr:P4HA1-like protein [Mya arenaria]
MKIRVILWALTCSFVIDIHLCHIYTSSHGVHNHLELERKILDSLTDYIRRQEKNGLHFDSSIKEAIENIETKNNVSLSNEDFATPISVYHVLSRATRDWVTLERKMTCEEDEDCPVLTGADVIEVVKRKSGYRWPEADDINLASRAILNVWNVYDLDLETVLTGKVGHVSNDAIDADAVFTIANAARDFGLLYEAIKWFEYLAENLSKYDSDHDVKHSALVRRLALTYKEMENIGPGVPTRSWTDFWLSNPTYGGTVVFPKMDISAHIQKGSAIVWENLKQNGKPSPKSTHQYCPSIVGPQLAISKTLPTSTKEILELISE